MATRSWTTLREISGTVYKIHHLECDYYGGSKMYSSWMERVEDEQSYGRTKRNVEEAEGRPAKERKN